MMFRRIVIDNHEIGDASPTYFVADIGANHDGDLSRAIDLIYLAADAGADAAKFQHFSAPTIVSDIGFRSLTLPRSHQSSWSKSVYDTYSDASLNLDWTPILKRTCDDAGITFFTAPYSLELVDVVDPFVPAFKVGSGDITWLEIISHMASKGKPVLLATGAASLGDVVAAVDTALERVDDVVLMQCNTNYTGDSDNVRYVNLAVLSLYRTMYPHLVLGLSDHTAGHTAVLGAVALGARVIEKHFTDDRSRVGPDHGFSLEPASWRLMVDATRELESAIGAPIKRIQGNERETVVLQRRAVRAARALQDGVRLSRDDLSVLRPCPADAIPASALDDVVGATLRRSVQVGDHLRWKDLN